MTLSDFKAWRRLKGGIWYYVQPYDNLYSFQHVRYWINRNPLYNEIIIKHEIYPSDRQRNFIFCPNCHVEMVSNSYCTKDEDLVYYECKHCGNKSEYNFDIAPIPVLIRSDRVVHI